MDRWANLSELLHDFRSIKVPKDIRTEIDGIRESVQAGRATMVLARRMEALARRYHRQLTELREARERARRTNGRRAMGMTQAEAQKRVKDREDEMVRRRSDLGL